MDLGPLRFQRAEALGAGVVGVALSHRCAREQRPGSCLGSVGELNCARASPCPNRGPLACLHAAATMTSHGGAPGNSHTQQSQNSHPVSSVSAGKSDGQIHVHYTSCHTKCGATAGNGHNGCLEWLPRWGTHVPHRPMWTHVVCDLYPAQPAI